MLFKRLFETAYSEAYSLCKNFDYLESYGKKLKNLKKL